MTVHVAICPHFHQPHFQLYRTREEAFVNSYQPWLEMLKQAVNLDNFYINLHFSGPFLYWIKEQKTEYIPSFTRDVLASGKIGLIGGLADEAFSQLSSRPDDVCYQVEAYDHLLAQLTGVSAPDWQAIHIVEREAGENLLGYLAWTARRLGVQPIFYLDAETYYETHFAYPGSEHDYCKKFFNFHDPYSITTISHLPEEMLYYALRDEVMGQQYYALPVHAQFRYHLLKRNAFNPNDRSNISPKQYWFMIKEAGQRAQITAESLGIKQDPMVLIFEDAEKFGQWSHDPQGDTEWFMELFHLLTKDPEICMTGPRTYLEKQGFIGTYPARTSHSYPEWENWTAHRGIRGVVFGDERLSRVMSRLRDVEKKQNLLEKELYYNTQHHHLKWTMSAEMETGLLRAVMNSPERYSFFRHLVNRYYSQPYRQAYQILMRIRNLVYQEDPKWASRHPSYGSSPYYDLQALSYLELAERLIDQVRSSALGSKFAYPTLEIRDWDFDGQDEVVVRTEGQMAVADTRGGSICYQQAVDPGVGHDLGSLLHQLDEFAHGVPAYSMIHRHVYPLVFMETDSSLTRVIYPEGGRQERTRSYGRLEFALNDGQNIINLGYIDEDSYQLDEAKIKGSGALIRLKNEGVLGLPDGQQLKVEVAKHFYIYDFHLGYRAEVQVENPPPGLCLVPQLVTSAAPSDEVDFKPVAYLGICGQGRTIPYDFINTTKIGFDCKPEFRSLSHEYPHPEEIHYLYTIKNGADKEYKNLVRFRFENGHIIKFRVSPGVSQYYSGFVFPDQSKLGMHTSGLLLEPYVEFRNGRAEFEVSMDWRFGTRIWKEEFSAVIPMVSYQI
ncbi:MAG: hypothetical protein ACM3NT_03485 [Methylocystaceae bacterium]